jgi:hypothetical protein
MGDLFWIKDSVDEVMLRTYGEEGSYLSPIQVRTGLELGISTFRGLRKLTIAVMTLRQKELEFISTGCPDIVWLHLVVEGYYTSDREPSLWGKHLVRTSNPTFDDLELRLFSG